MKSTVSETIFQKRRIWRSSGWVIFGLLLWFLLSGCTKTKTTPASELPGSFTNSLGMTFVPVPGTDVLFCVHETRVRDFAAYAAANPGVDMSWKDVEYVERIYFPAWQKRIREIWARITGRTPGPNYRVRVYKPTGDHPVVNVNWEDARAFCEWLSAKEGKLYHLPTDHEWSVAVGIGHLEDPKQTPEEKKEKLAGVYPWGSAWPPPKGAGNFYSDLIEGYRDSHYFTAPVKSYNVGKHGIYDLSGNVWEWCEDWYSNERTDRASRGGSWNDYSEIDLRSSYRNNDPPTFRVINSGFRCVVLSARLK